MDTNRLRSIIDQEFDRILISIDREFSSQKFIAQFHKVSPGSYAEGLHEASCARVLHSWIARWYLNGKVLEGRLDKRQIVQEISINGNKTRNRLWLNRNK